MNVFKKRIFAAVSLIFVIAALVTISPSQAEAKSKLRRKVMAIAKTQRSSLSAYSRRRVAAGDVNGDGRADASRRFFLLPYIEQDNLYKQRRLP